ncbi:hypothetical protein LTR67_007433 [Exophiala xenobiotica]
MLDLEEKDALNKNVCYAIKRIEKNIAPQYTTRDTLYSHIERSLDAIGWNYIFLPGIRLSTTKRAIQRSILQSLPSKSVTQIASTKPDDDYQALWSMGNGLILSMELEKAYDKVP